MESILDGLIAALNAGAAISAAMKEAFEKASVIVVESVRDHPVFTAAVVTVVVVGVQCFLSRGL